MNFLIFHEFHDFFTENRSFINRPLYRPLFRPHSWPASDLISHCFGCLCVLSLPSGSPFWAPFWTPLFWTLCWPDSDPEVYHVLHHATVPITPGTPTTRTTTTTATSTPHQAPRPCYSGSPGSFWLQWGCQQTRSFWKTLKINKNTEIH